jgi:hypothetical protein
MLQEGDTLYVGPIPNIFVSKMVSSRDGVEAKRFKPYQCFCAYEWMHACNIDFNNELLY